MKNSNTKSIDKALRAHYASKSLSETQLNNLWEMQLNAFDTQSSVETKTSWWNRLLPDTRNYRYAFYVTAFMLLGCLFAVYSLLDRAPLSQRIMSEIVYNHKQDMPIEIASSSLADISKYLSKLNFSMVLPGVLSDPNWKLLGGRYCSINGKIAAQLKVKNLKDNTTYTFYQAAIDEDLEESNTTSMSDTIDGVGVSIWREQGLLQGLAREKFPH